MRNLLWLCLLLVHQGWAEPTRYVLVNTVVHSAVEDAFGGYVVVNGDTVEEVGRGQPPSLPQVDLGGMHLYPGLIDVDSCIGIAGVESLRAVLDHQEVGELNPNLVAQYAYRAESDLVSVARSQGILYTGVNPRGGLISGQGSVMRTWGWTWEDMTFRPTWALAVDYPSMTLSLEAEASDRTSALDSLGRALYFLETAFAQARSYGGSTTDLKWGALKPYALGKEPVLLRVNNESQIESALEWSKGHSLRPVLVAGSKIHEYAEELSEHGVPVVYSTLFNANPAEHESYDLHYRTPLLLLEKGVLVALSPNGLAFDARELRDLAGRARAFGLTELQALQTVTLNPAKILGVDSDLGSIEKGKKASFVLCDGDLLEVAPRVVRAWGEGRELDLGDRQKELYQKYRERLQEIKGRSAPKE